ncbi:hypothetical protein [Pseudomonas syringae]|uniref:hypothetical protein n=1 Tax=Pseudomonas syringae TaxID=317 RepID=UPI001F3893FE|nr:hypothetical protein [Pseudomonas syringae]MCF5371991.1 hypothetical protein [Pseudomonas syringae]MCF5382012.1 hypothetical protein [Pseudomonas syringae]MCF5419455.1 hypothetical protein [Pseudomonas syringae]MCF5452001.1 hypothetical protein [Pseudomonas syringae]MCF5456288.1 hypothetical protein [Pseudomonas syringae]
MSTICLIDHAQLQALLDALLAADTTGTAHESAYVIAAQNSLSAPQEYLHKPDRELVRQSFESACNISTSYRFPLGAMVINGDFHHYVDSDTDSAFAGWRGGFNQGVNWERGQRRVQPTPAVDSAPVVEQDGKGELA